MTYTNPIDVLRPLGLELTDLKERHTMYLSIDEKLHIANAPDHPVGPTQVQVPTHIAFRDGCPYHDCREKWIRTSPEALTLTTLARFQDLLDKPQISGVLTLADYADHLHLGQDLLATLNAPPRLEFLRDKISQQLKRRYTELLKTLASSPSRKALSAAWTDCDDYSFHCDASELYDQFTSPPTHLVATPDLSSGNSDPTMHLLHATSLSFMHWPAPSPEQSQFGLNHILLAPWVVAKLFLQLDRYHETKAIALYPTEDPAKLVDLATTLWNSSDTIPFDQAVQMARLVN